MALLDGGDTLFRHPFKVSYRENENIPYNRFIVSVPKKTFKRAVKRNLIKRRVKEAIRLNQNMLGSDKKRDFLFVYVGKEIYEFSKIDKRVRDILANFA